MAFALFFPQSEKTVKKYGTASKYMLYNGPFVQKGWTGSNLSWKMVKNKDYWDKKNVKVDQINWSVRKTPATAYNLYQTSKLNAFSLDSLQTKQLAKKSGFQLVNNGWTAYLQYNLQKDKNPANAKIRQAISMAIDRNGLCSTLGGNNKAAKTFTASGLMHVDMQEYTSGISSASETYNQYNPKKAWQNWASLQLLFPSWLMIGQRQKDRWSPAKWTGTKPGQHQGWNLNRAIQDSDGPPGSREVWYHAVNLDCRLQRRNFLPRPDD